MIQEIWKNHLKKACSSRITARTFAAFNTNVDVVVHLSAEKIKRIFDLNPDLDLEVIRTAAVSETASLETREDFLAMLRDRLAKGKSFHIVVENPNLLEWIDGQFTDEQESMGGQAGIIANQMAALEAESMVYTPLLTAKQAGLFRQEVLTPLVEGDGLAFLPVKKAIRTDVATKINWIFEYPKDEVIDMAGEEIVTPRANRVIIATRPKGAVMAFDERMFSHLEKLGAAIDVAFMAGYHYASPKNPDGTSYEEFIGRSVAELKALRRGNPNLKIHFEYVPMKHKELEKDTLSTIGMNIHSFGINENEIRRVLDEFGYEQELSAIHESENAFTLYQGAVRLMESLDVERIQVHNLGYYVVLLRKPYYTSPQRVRQACLFASSVNGMKAKYGGYVELHQLDEASETPLSDIGLGQISLFAEKVASSPQEKEYFLKEGILERDDHYVLVVPAHVIPNPVSTVGMGDTISSSTYAAEVEGRVRSTV